MSDLILHITTRRDWQAAQQAGQYVAPSLSSQGYIHCSTPSQAVAVAEKYYRGQTGLVLLVIDSRALDSSLKWEPPDPGMPLEGKAAGELFPHVYGPIHPRAVVQALEFDADKTGEFKLPPLIRPARDTDAGLAASVLHSSMGELADYLFGDGTHPVEKSLARLFQSEGNRFSWQYSWVLEDPAQAAGFLLAFPGQWMARLQMALFAGMFSVYGLAGTIGMVGRMLPLVNVREAEADEYYISNVGVLPPFQRRGYGTRLMAFAEEQARKAGLKKCSLTVDVQNSRAIRLYQQLDYKIASSRHFTGRVAAKESGMHRMVKELL